MYPQTTHQRFTQPDIEMVESHSSFRCHNALNPSMSWDNSDNTQSHVDLSKALNNHDSAMHYFCTGNVPDNTYSTPSPRQSIPTMQYTAFMTNSNNFPTVNPSIEGSALCDSMQPIQRKKGKRNKIGRNNRRTLSHYYVPVENRAQGIIQISRSMTEKIVPQFIDEVITDVYDYMDKSIALCQSKVLLNGLIRIINFDFHCRQSKQVLFCVVCKANSEVKRVRGFQWKMLDQLFTAQQISAAYGISDIYLPKYGRYSSAFVTEFNYGERIRYILSGKKQRMKILNNTRWCRTDVLFRVNNKKRLTLSVTKPEFIKTCSEYMRDIGNIKLIPIVMFGVNDQYSIQHVCVVRIAEGIAIGISFRFDAENNEVMVCGIHLEKEYIQRQHELVLPQCDHNCHCLDDFESNIDDLRIGNPDDDRNRVKHYKQQVEQLKQVVLLLQCNNSTNISNVAYSDNALYTTDKL